MLDVLEKCLISDSEGAVKGFLDIDPSNCLRKVCFIALIFINIYFFDFV